LKNFGSIINKVKKVNFTAGLPKKLMYLFGVNAGRVKRYYHINQTGHWEEDKHIPLRKQSDAIFAQNGRHRIEAMARTKGGHQ